MRVALERIPFARVFPQCYLLLIRLGHDLFIKEQFINLLLWNNQRKFKIIFINDKN